MKVNVDRDKAIAAFIKNLEKQKEDGVIVDFKHLGGGDFEVTPVAPIREINIKITL